MLSIKKCSCFVAISTLLFATAAWCELTIEVIGGGADQIPITIVPFEGDNKFEYSSSQIISADLYRSGLFKLEKIDDIGQKPSEVADVDYVYWREEAVQTLVIGKINELDDGRFRLRFRVLDVFNQAVILSGSFIFQERTVRYTAHRVADAIYEKLTGDVGVFATKICYVVKKKKKYELQVADADGFNPHVVHRHPEPVISPRWSPDGTRIAYVSFEKKKPIVYVLNIYKGTRVKIASFEGSNSAPAWAPDGSRLAITLTKDGISQIYSISAKGRGLKRLTRSRSIDTEPNFSPDGKYILFTSDRAGGPQIYRMRSNGGGQPRRMTFEGKYNVSPRYSPDGKSFVYVHRNSGQFNVAVQDFSSGVVQILTAGKSDQSPTFAPNGKIILYASEIGRRGILAAVSSDGRIRQRYTSRSGDVREPAWGPLQTRGRKGKN